MPLRGEIAVRVEDIEVQKKGAHLGFTELCESVGVARGIYVERTFTDLPLGELEENWRERDVL